MTRRDVEALVRSVLVPGFDGTTVPDWLARELDAGLAGVCWFGQNIDPAGTRPLAGTLHGFRDDVIVMSDEEGGGVTRLQRRDGSSWPGPAALGRVDDIEVTRTVAAGLGAQCRAAGVDLPLAPVVDVNAEPDNPVIGVRSFGAAADLVARHGAAYVRGLLDSGVLACAKHFPGHGSTLVDSHVGLPVIHDQLSVVQERDLAPFAAAVDAGVPCVMTAHVVVSALDDVPATMSPVVLGMLRRELGFEGVICTDALDMDAIARGVGRPEGAVRALAAGADLVCVGNPGFPAAYDAEAVTREIVTHVADAVERGDLSRERLEEARGRVREMGDRAAAHRDDPLPDLTPVLQAAADAADQALEVHGDVQVSGPAQLLRVDGVVNVAAGRAPAWVSDAFERARPGLSVLEPQSADDAVAALDDATAVIVLGARPDDAARAIVAAVVDRRPDTVVVHLGLPETAGAADAPRRVHTFGSGTATAEAVARRVLGVQS